MSNAPSLADLPQEILDQIAYISATQDFLGPPSSLAALLATNHAIHDRLSLSANPLLYASIFEAKFDLGAPRRRYGVELLRMDSVVAELQRRFTALKLIRAQYGAISDPSALQGKPSIQDLLLQAYLLMLDNDGKNKRQLCEYARMDAWLDKYWTDENGASLVRRCWKTSRWPPLTDTNTLALWLYWMLLKPARAEDVSWQMLQILKTFALGANRYALAHHRWNTFSHTEKTPQGLETEIFATDIVVRPLSAIAAATLSYLAVENQWREWTGVAAPLPPSLLVTSTASAVAESLSPSTMWDCDWRRVVESKNHTPMLEPGSLEGVWQGLFTYTEFTAYAALLAGAAPQVLQDTLVMRHMQTWKLREHHLVRRDDQPEGEEVLPVSAKDDDALTAFFPDGALLKETMDGLEVKEPGREKALWYSRLGKTNNMGGTLVDVIIMGEGHSNWGNFRLRGRVRPCDGFISFTKEYTDGDRGQWVYRGYLVGGAQGNLAGRWRDTLTPAENPGYEGCFALTRRR